LRITGIKNLLNAILKTKKYMLNEKPDLILFSPATFKEGFEGATASGCFRND